MLNLFLIVLLLQFHHFLTALIPVSPSKGLRSKLISSARSLIGGVTSILVIRSPCVAETINAETQSTVSEFDPLSAASFAERVQSIRPANSDEIDLEFTSPSLGIKLQETSYKGFPVCTIKEINDPSINSKIIDSDKERGENYGLRIGAIISRVGQQYVDGKPLREIAALVSSSPRPLRVRFRDPSYFFEQLDSTKAKPLRLVSTSYLPANARDAGAGEQTIVVERLSLPPPDERLRAAQMLDVLEIQYVATVQGSDVIVDSSAERSPPGTSSKSIYYILGQQNGPPGKYPRGWDLTLRGMVVGEKRRITLPYTLAYDQKGDKLRKIPPYATLVYTVRLLSLT